MTGVLLVTELIHSLEIGDICGHHKIVCFLAVDTTATRHHSLGVVCDPTAVVTNVAYSYIPNPFEAGILRESLVTRMRDYIVVQRREKIELCVVELRSEVRLYA